MYKSFQGALGHHVLDSAMMLNAQRILSVILTPPRGALEL